MLADAKSEIKPEAAVAEQDPLDRQLKAFQERLQTQTVLPPTNPIPTNEGNSQERDEEPAIKFGWEEFKDGPTLPFIQRDSERYVATHIVAELVYKKIEKDFTTEVLFCMAFLMDKMSQKEADTFNEINVDHSDKKIVGDYIFRANEFMIKLDFVKNLVEYHRACQHLILKKIKENDLFGFLQIAGDHQVPFVWNGDQKLLPLFYFEGQSEYLDARSIDLTDPFKIGYLKFCCKVQKIRKDVYEHNPLKVVDLEDVKKLFPADTTFELSLPNKVNQDLLAPEVRIALLHGFEEETQRTQIMNPSSISPNVASSVQKINNNNSSNASSISEPISNNLHHTVSVNKLPLNITENTQEAKGNPTPSVNKTLYTEVRRHKELMRERNKANRAQHAHPMEDIEAKRLKMGAAESELQPRTLREDIVESSTSIVASASVQTPNQTGTPQPAEYDPVLQSLLRSRLSQDCTITPGHRQISNSHFESGSKSFPFTQVSAIPRRLSQDICSSSPTSPGQITNVPYRSPPTASSPGFSQSNHSINGATQMQTTITSAAEMANQVVKQNRVCTSGTYQPLSYEASYGNQQLNGASATYNAQTQWTVNSSEPIYQNTAASVAFSHVHCHPSIGNRPAMQVQHDQLNQNHLNRLKQQGNPINLPQYHMQQPRRISYPSKQFSFFPSSPEMSYLNQNLPNHPVPASWGHQSNPGSYYQQYGNPTQPVIQNFNMFSTNYTLSQSCATNTSIQPNNVHSQDINNNVVGSTVGSTPMKVIKHPQNLGPDPYNYIIRLCAVKNSFLFGIRKYSIGNYFLVNLSEFVEKVLGLNPFVNQPDLLSRFKSIYRLNGVQQMRWECLIRDEQLEFVGPFKDLFVDYSEIPS